MPAATEPKQVNDFTCRYVGGSGAADNDVVIRTENVSRYNTFMLMSTAGAMDVSVCLDGQHFSVDPIALTDMGAASNTPVLLTAPGRVFAFRGSFERIEVRQNGDTPVEDACLRCTIL